MPDLDVIKPLVITFYDDITHIANDKRATFEIGRQIAIKRRLGLQTSINMTGARLPAHAREPRDV